MEGEKKEKTKKIEEIDCLSFMLLNERAKNIELQTQLLERAQRDTIERRNELLKRFIEKYELGQEDVFNPETGDISRKE